MRACAHVDDVRIYDKFVPWRQLHVVRLGATRHGMEYGRGAAAQH